MGAIASTEAPKTGTKKVPNPQWELPKPIFVDEIMSEDKEAQKYLCKCLSENTYAIITLENSENKANIAGAIDGLFKDRNGYFEQSQDVKQLNIAPDGNNMGYIKVGNTREYIKLRISDPEELWPKHPPTIRNNWTNVHTYLKDISWKCFLAISNYEESKLNDETLEAIEEFVQIKSSISLIHYYTVISDDKRCVCATHEDTGLLTFGVCSDSPGLIIWDPVKNDWVEIEKVAKPGSLILFVGQKVPMFSGSSTWKPTTHKVEIPTGTERHSFVFLLDVAK